MSSADAEKLREIIEECQIKNACELDVRYDEPLCEHTTFKVGGPADCWLSPRGEGFPDFCASLLNAAHESSVPVFILGGGANIVVSDKGFRGIVLDTGEWKGFEKKEGEGLIFYSGTAVDEAVDCAASEKLSGLDFLAGMPGSIGGAVYMNARCYDSEIADILSWTEIIDFSGEPQIKKIVTGQPPEGTGFGYKQSPFQGKAQFILRACFNLKQGEKSEILAKIRKNRKDRQEKGHYLFPCAGSAFKNNRDFGKPTGLIIDELGLKGLSVGGAQIAPFHGNIVINTGNAKAADIRDLVDEVTAKVKTAAGFALEPEILFIGEW